MQKDIQGQSHFPPNQQILYTQQQPLQPGQMQGQIIYQPRNIAAGQQQIRPMGMTQRFNQYPQQTYVANNMYAQGHPQNDMMAGNYQGGYVIQQPYMQNGGQQYGYSQQPVQYQNVYQHRPVQGNYVLQQQQLHNNTPQLQQGVPRMSYSPQVPVSHAPQQTQPYIQNQIQITPQPPQHEVPPAVKKPVKIKLTDPSTGKDVTNEVFKKKEKPVPVVVAAPFVPAAPVVSVASAVVNENKATEANAKFLAQVFQKIATDKGEPKTDKTESTDQTEANTEKISEKIVPSVIVKDAVTDIAAATEEPITKESTTKEYITKEPVTQEPTPKVIPVTPATVVTETLPEKDTLPKEIPASIVTETKENKLDITKPVEVPVNEENKTDVVEPINEVTVAKTETIKVEETPISEPVIEQTQESAVESVVESAIDPIETAVTENESTIQDETSKSAFNTVKKKKGKNRFKDIDSKDNNNDMLSAFKDKPEIKEVESETKEVEKVVKEEVSLEDATWEDKEKAIEKEIIKHEDAEEVEVIPPKIAETKIIKLEDVLDASEEDKLQYDRDFLLKFQFAPICTSKPAGLPNIDIVLDQAHAPTKALIPGQRLAASNDFMPVFMRSQSGGGGGRSSGGGRSKDRRGPPPSGGGGNPKKIIHVPKFAEVELQKSDNAWVRPSEKAKELSDEQREMDEVCRNVRSILNKLTPQKFQTLVNQMLTLKVNSVEKLEKAIDLIFEKAVGEPGFSVAYAHMCRKLSEAFKAPVTQQTVDGKVVASTVTFRKILLNKCQKEFEKDSSDEKELEESRNKVFEKEDERKAWKEELDLKEMLNRRRMLGNIRFIGELFKLKMISENIMHNCIIKLLRAEKQESLEDQLECLCKLLATIGKDLDHKKCKPRMDQYFDQMTKIISKKKISSRIKFALQDVIELRGCGWVPRRDEGNPKTIDQIHKEAQLKEKNEDMARQQDKVSRKLDPRDRDRRGAGRDSPVVHRGGGGGGSQSNPLPTSADGWTNVSTKSARQIAAAPVDASKFKITKKREGEMTLGPGRSGVWSRGASGGSSRSGSGSNTPTNEIEQRNNRYDILTDSNVTLSTLDTKRGSRDGTPRRGTPPFQKKTDDRNSALRAVKDMTSGSNSRNQSPVRDSSSPANQTQAPAVSPNPEVTEEQIAKVTKATVEEYMGCRDLKEAILCIKELNAPSLHHVFIREAMLVVIEKKSEHRQLVGKLLHDMIDNEFITMEQMCNGMESLVEFAPDFAVDVPLIYKYFGEILGGVVFDRTLPLNKVKDVLEPLIKDNKAGDVMAEALSVAVQIAGGEELVTDIWSESSLKWDMLLNNMDVSEFIKDMKMEFTMASPPSHASQVQQELIRLLKEKNDNVNTNIISYIEEKVAKERQCHPEFIHMLTSTVCNSSIKEDKNSCTCDRNLLKLRKNILERFINSRKELELQALFALQQIAAELNHPRELLTQLFEQLYEDDVISEDTFYVWELSKEYPDGKGTALSSVKGFLTWLHKAEEESNEEDSTITNPIQNETTNDSEKKV